MGKGLALAAVAVAAVCVAASAGARQSTDPPLLIGANYGWFDNANCDLTNHGIVHDGATHQTLIAAELQAMHLAGIQSLRTIIWNMHDATGQQWGVVDSAGGRMSARATLNLISYLKLVRAYGFRQLTIAFSPQWTNDPIGWPENRYDPTLFAENWHFIQYVRSFVKKYGPPITHFDLLNEGAPSVYLATKEQLGTYDAQIYEDYVDAYGNDDVTISSIVDAGDQTRIANLVDYLTATGRPLPTWWEIHPYSDATLQALQQTDATLTSKGVSAPISVGETYYDDAPAAAAIGQYVAGSSRPLLEAMSWPIARGSSCSGVTPPYRAHELYTALTGSDPAAPAITATVGSTVAMTVGGMPLLGLEAGTYSITVNDNAPGATFTLLGPGFTRSVRAAGVYHWTLNLAPGLYLYVRNGHGQSFRVF